MRKFLYKAAMRLALPLLAVSWGPSFGLGQAPSAAPETANATANTTPSTKTKDAKQTPPPGKRRGVTNDMRWAAAIRTADRRAKAHAKGGKSPNMQGVKP